MPYHKKVKQLLWCTVCSFPLYLHGVPVAANIEVSKFVEVGATMSDNIFLESTDSESNNELIFNITPSIQFKYSGNRIGVIALAQLQSYQFNTSKVSTVNPKLDVRARGTLIDELLFLDTKLTLSKNLADADTITPLDDGEAAIGAEAKLIFEHSLGPTIDLTGGYKISTISEDPESNSQTSEHTIDFYIDRKPTANGLIWGLGGGHTLDESGTDKFVNSFLIGKLGTTISQTLLAEINYGVERQEFSAASDEGNTVSANFDDEPLWSAALRWTPNRLTKFTIGYEERFFGNGPTMELQYRLKNSSLIASYTRNVSRRTDLLDRISGLSSNIDDDITDTESIALDSALNLVPFNELFINNRFRIGYKLTGSRSDFIADAVYSDQESLTGPNTRNTLLGRLIFDRWLSEQLSVRLQYNRQQSESPNFDNLNYTENRFGIKIIYSFEGRNRFSEGEFEIE